MKESREILFDASRFKLTARKSDSKLNGQSFSANTQKGGISMEVTGDGMPKDDTNNEQEGLGAQAEPRAKSATEQLFKALDEVINPENEPMSAEVDKIVRERMKKGLTQDQVQAERVISLEEQGSASLQSEPVVTPQSGENPAELIVKSVDTGEIGKLRDVVSDGQLLNMIKQANPKVDKAKLEKEFQEVSGEGDEAKYREKLKDVLAKAISGEFEEGEAAQEEEVISLTTDEEATTETVEDSNEFGLSPEEEADPVVVFKMQLLGPLGAMIRAKAGDMNEKIRYEQRIAGLLGLEGDEFLQKYPEVMQEIFGEENPAIPEDLIVEVDTEEIARESAMDEFSARDQVFEKLFDDLEDVSSQEIEAFLNAGGEALVRLLSDGTGHEDQYVELLYELLEKSGDIKADFKDFLAEVRADASTVDSDADKDKENDEGEPVLGLRYERIDNIKDKSELVDYLLVSMKSFTQEQLRQTLLQVGEGLIRTASNGSDREDEFAIKLEELIIGSGDVKGEFAELLEEVRQASADGGEDDGGKKPPTDNEAGGDKDEDDYENSEEYKKMEAKWLDYRLKEFAFNNRRKPSEEEKANLLNENDKKFILVGSPPPLEVTTRSEKQRGNEWLEKIRAGFNQIEDITFFRKSLKEIMYPRIAGLVDQQYAGENTTFKKKLDDIFNADNLDFAKDELNTYLSEIKSHFAHSAEKEEREKKPESFEDLLELIMRKETDEYKTGGIRELIDENGAIRPENFAAWARKKGRFWSNFNPDSSVDLYREISVPLYYSPLAFNEMVTNPQFFRRREVNLVADEDGNPVVDNRTGEILYNNTYHEDKYYEKIKEIIMNDIFYYNQSRNYNIAYIETMEQDDKLGGTVAAIMQKNVFTKKGFETFFSLPGTASTDFTQKVKEAGKENFLVGEGAALATTIYNSISDIQELRTILGDDSTFLKKEYRVDDSEELKVDIEGLGVDGKKAELKYSLKKGSGEANVPGVGPIKWDEDWFDADGKLKTDEFSEGRFADFINIFNEQKKDQRIIDEVRHRVRQSIMEKILPKMEADEGIVARSRKNAEKRIRARQDDLRTKKVYSEDPARQEEVLQQEIALETQKQITQFAYEDALHSEEIVFTSLRWTGVAANNDTTATGFDAGTKFFQTAAYRIRQGAESRGGGAVGNIKNIMIYKRLVAPFLMGIKTVNNKTPLELAQEIALNMKKTDAVDGREFAGNLTKQLEFVSNTMKDYGANHYNRGGQVFEGLSGAKELDIGKVVQYDLHKGAVVNKGALISEVCEGLLKPERYRTSTYNGTDYSKESRFIEANNIITQTRTIVVKDENGDPVRDGSGNIVTEEVKYRVLNYETKALGAAMYGEQVFDNAELFKTDGKIDYVKVQKNRGELWKEGVSVRIASELASHIDHHDPVEHWSLVKIETFFAGLGLIPADIHVDEKNFWNNHAEKKFFNEKLQKRMRKLSKTERWRIYGRSFGIEGGGGFLAGLLETLGAMVKEATR